MSSANNFVATSNHVLVIGYRKKAMSREQRAVRAATKKQEATNNTVLAEGYHNEAKS